MQVHACALLLTQLLSLFYLSSQSSTPNQAKEQWIVTEWHADAECTSLQYAHLQVLGKCYQSDTGGSMLYTQYKTGVMVQWDCTDSLCDKCTSLPQNIPITEQRECVPMSNSSDSSSDFSTATYRTNVYITSTFPSSFSFTSVTIEKNYAVQYVNTTCGGTVVAVDVQPLWCFEACTPPTEVFCTIPSFLLSPSHSKTKLPEGAIIVIVVMSLITAGMIFFGGISYYFRKYGNSTTSYATQEDASSKDMGRLP